MRFLFIINIDMSLGGPSVHLLNDIMLEAKKRGHHVTRFEKRYGNDSWILEQENNHQEDIYRLECANPKTLKYGKRYLNDVKYAKYCKRLARNKVFDCIFVQSCNTAAFQLSWIKKMKCPVIYNVQDIFPLDIVFEGVLNKHNPVYLVMDLLQKYAYRKSTKVVTISLDMKQTLIDLGVPSNKIHVVYNWAYHTSYNYEDERFIFEKYLSDGKFHVVYAGNIGIAQSVETLIKAADLLREYDSIEIVIFGSGSRRKKCEELIAELQLTNLLFNDLVPQNYAQYVYNLADINIVTLIHGIMRTSLPSKTAACYNSGKPVVYCIERSSNTLNIMQEHNPLIYQCEPESPEQLATLILSLYEKYKNGDYISSTIELYEEIMKPQSAHEYINILESLQIKK